METQKVRYLALLGQADGHLPSYLLPWSAHIWPQVCIEARSPAKFHASAAANYPAGRLP
ncbi:MAG: hypothetical protein RLZ05_1524 [Bacteroidota bacterium]|jgi:hypothetical protein